jgi:hypothetical protein
MTGMGMNEEFSDSGLHPVNPAHPVKNDRWFRI